MRSGKRLRINIPNMLPKITVVALTIDPIGIYPSPRL
jgi:hypothetical protein